MVRHGRTMAAIVAGVFSSIIAGAATPAFADTIVDGATSAATRYDRPSSFDVDPGCGAASVFSADGRDVDYAAIPFHVVGDAPRALDAEILVAGTSIIDPVLSVYCYFDPISPDLDLVMVEDDTAGSLYPRIAPERGIMLEPGQTYVFVVAPFSRLDLGAGEFRLRLGDGFAVGTAPGPVVAYDRSDDLGREDMHRAIGLLALRGARAMFDHARDMFDPETPFLVSGDGVSLILGEPTSGRPDGPVTALFAHRSDNQGMFAGGTGDSIADARVIQAWAGFRTGLTDELMVGGVVGYEVSEATSHRAATYLDGEGWQGLAFASWRGVPGIEASVAIGGGRFDNFLTAHAVFGFPPSGGRYRSWRAMALGDVRVFVPVFGQTVAIAADGAVLAEWLGAYTDLDGTHHEAARTVVGEAGMGVHWQGDVIVEGEIFHPRVGAAMRWQSPIRDGASSLAGTISIGSAWTIAPGLHAIGDWSITLNDDGRSASETRTTMVRLTLEF